MANTYTSLHYHFTFSTKNREPWITMDIESSLGIYRRCRACSQDDGSSGRRY
jgi:REP element-mobilizing transposase RayT